jgi:hypothetical protein
MRRRLWLRWRRRTRRHHPKRLSERAVLLARQGGLPERAALFQGACAVWNALFGVPEEARKNAFGALYPVYLRGLAYSRLGRPGEAAIEFQEILDHPGLVLNDPIGPMARLQLARALSDSAERAKSASIYNDLLTSWKDADPGMPVLTQTKVEYARLQ